MKYFNPVFTILLVLLCVNAEAKSDKNVSFSRDYFSDREFYAELGVDLNAVFALESHPEVVRHNLNRYGLSYQDLSGWLSEPDEPVDEYDPIADYETQLPHATQPKISRFEKAVLSAYLDNVDDVWLAKFLAVYHLKKSLLKKGSGNGRALAHTIIARYFLYRVVQLGGGERWVEITLAKTQRKLDKIMNSRAGLNLDEYHEAHLYFFDAFNLNEQNRYRAVAKLLDDFVQHPNNLSTNAYLTASNIWVGGEAGYDDPTVLYSFVLSSFFSVRSVELARQAEQAWLEDPDNHQRFRLAPILGGWTVPARRWLAKLHNDADAVALLDAEHREWLTIHRAFHSASIGLMLFEEPENFWEGFFAWDAGFRHCEEIPTLRSCIDSPRFSYNLLSFLLGGADYFIKAGQLDAAQFILMSRFVPFFQYEGWDLGREAWAHRENNMMAIYELYNNDDPDDDPTHFLLMKRKWGPSTITCQTCHQRQSREWTEEEINTIPPRHESIATIGTWPVETTTWYGAVK